MVILKAEHISKQYRLGLIGTGTLGDDLKRFWYRMRGKEDPFLKIGEVNDRSTTGASNYVWALQDINFEVAQGEVLGIIGKNGAGKSTLLKILSRVTAPTTGEIKTRGRIASLLEVGTGFHPELTGRENIYLNGAILGMTKAEIRHKEDEIIAFSGCERYVDTPVKRYSSGMRVRLAFAVAAFLEPDILVIDEVLAVGDAEFQKKAIGKMQDISKGEGRTVLFVSHNMASIRKLCTRAILLESGLVLKDGNVDDVLELYLKGFEQSKNYISRGEGKEVYVSNAKVLNPVNRFLSDENIKFSFLVENTLKNVKDVFLMTRVIDDSDRTLFCCEIKLIEDRENYTLTIPKNTLVKGRYKLNLILYKPAVQQFDVVDECCEFIVLDNIDTFSHLENFDIGKIYVSNNWLQ